MKKVYDFEATGDLVDFVNTSKNKKSIENEN